MHSANRASPPMVRIGSATIRRVYCTKVLERSAAEIGGMGSMLALAFKRHRERAGTMDGTRASVRGMHASNVSA